MQYQRDIFGNYLFSGPVDELTILHVAGHIRETHFHRETAMRDPQTTREFLIAKLAHLPHEVFAVIFLDNRHRLLAFEVLFTGTLDGASVYPREVVRRVLHHNAAAVVLAHNHPSGYPEPSMADRSITAQLKTVLGTIDTRVLDHIIVGGSQTVSFAERGLI